MSTVYKLLDFKWWDIDSILYLADSYNNTGGFDDSSQVVGGVSGIIRYNILNTTSSTPFIAYYWLIYFRQLPTSNNPPRSLGFRTDRWSTITARQGSNFQITHNGTTYWVYKSANVTYIPSTDKWQITSDNVDSNPVFVTEGTSKKNTVHDLGDKTGSTDQQIYLEGLQYLLNEPAQGQGTVTLSIKKPGQTLNFTSRLLSKTVRQYISEDTTIDIQNASSDYEILFYYRFSNSGLAIFQIDSDFNGETYNGSEIVSGKTISGNLIESTIDQYLYPTVTAKETITAQYGSANDINSYSNYINGDTIVSGNTSPNYERFVIAKKSSSTQAPEIVFAWEWGSTSMQSCIVKRDGTILPWSQTQIGTYGDYLACPYSADGGYHFVLKTKVFSGTLKYYTVDNEWVTLDPSTTHEISLNRPFIAIAIPS